MKATHPPTRPRGRTAKARSRFRLLFLLLLALCSVAAVASGALFSSGRPASAAPTQENTGISPEALAQIESLIAEKESRTGPEARIDSQLIYEMKMQRGEWITDRVPTVETDVEYADDDAGTVVVDIKADVSPGLLSQLRAGGAEIINTVANADSIRASVPLDNIEAIASMPGVTFIQPKQEAMVGSAAPVVVSDAPAPAHTSAPAHAPPDFDTRAAILRSRLSAVLRREGAEGNVAGIIPSVGVGSRTSEGVLTHGVFSARGTFHTDGTGIKIGVLSDGVTNLAASQAAGDLGPVTVLPGQAGASGDEGTAMLEIIHDMAPGAQLYFATAFNGITSFAQNIRDLRAAGCDIIVDDVFYYVETPFQDGQAPSIISNTNGGVVTQAINDVTAAGAMHFSSAGNAGNLNDGTSGVWEGDFVNGGATGAPIPGGSAGNLHQFTAGQNFNTLTVANTAAPIGLYWADPLGGSSNDYDLFRLNAAGTAIAASSTNIQNGTQDPYEQVSQSTTNPLIVVVRKTGAAGRFLHLNTNRGRLSVATTGQTHGHSGAANAFSCAATPAVGPFPNLFSAANVSETFTSDGPRRIFFQPNGTPYTPGNFASTGGTVRQKPDITAADGVSVTGVGGFPTTFFGTSAAAPHAAAIAGLIKAAGPALTNAQIRTALTTSAIDIETPGTDRDTGAGIIMPYAAMQAAGLDGTAFLEFGVITATENPGDGNGNIDAGEGATLVVNLKNTGVDNATNISTTLTTSTPGVTVMQPSSSAYPDLASGGGTGTNVTPFRFTVAGNVSCPTTIQFTLTVTYAGGDGNPQVMSFSVPTGPPATVIPGAIDLTAPTSGNGYIATTGTIATRHFRDSIFSACGSLKTFPGTTQPGTRQYDAYTFQTCPSSGPSCITVTLSGTNAINLFTAAYTGNFNPADLAQNYLADPGTSAASRTYSFNLPAGAQTFTVIVYDVPPALITPSGITYTLNVSGGCIGSCSLPNQVPVAKAKAVTVSADASCVANASVDDGSFDPDGDPLTITQSPAGPYPLGTTSVLLTVTDPRGASSQATGSVTVVDDTPPTVNAPANIIANADTGSCTAVLSVGTATAADNCDGAPTINGVRSDSQPLGAPYPVGTTTISWTATDDAGNTSLPAVQTVTVNDSQAPTVSAASATPNSLWPPNHQMVNVIVNYTASDNCGPVTSVLTVTSNEPVNGTGDGDTAPDWQVVDSHQVKLRAERAGGGTGRVYTITVTTTDGSGNQTVRTTTVSVPKSQKK